MSLTTAISQRPAPTIASYGFGSYAIDGTADTALSNITTSSTVSDVLVILDANISRAQTRVGFGTTGGTTGKATSSTGLG